MRNTFYEVDVAYVDKQNATIYSQKVVIDGFKRAYQKEFKDILPK